MCIRDRDSTYYYANSMQTAQRRIPIGGDGGKNKTWKEMLAVSYTHLDVYKRQIVYQILLQGWLAGKAFAVCRDGGGYRQVKRNGGIGAVSYTHLDVYKRQV